MSIILKIFEEKRPKFNGARREMRKLTKWNKFWNIQEKNKNTWIIDSFKRRRTYKTGNESSKEGRSSEGKDLVSNKWKQRVTWDDSWVQSKAIVLIS